MTGKLPERESQIYSTSVRSVVSGSTVLNFHRNLLQLNGLKRLSQGSTTVRLWSHGQHQTRLHSCANQILASRDWNCTFWLIGWSLQGFQLVCTHLWHRLRRATQAHRRGILVRQTRNQLSINSKLLPSQVLVMIWYEGCSRYSILEAEQFVWLAGNLARMCDSEEMTVMA